MENMHNKTDTADESDDTKGLSGFLNPSDTCVDYKSIKQVYFFAFYL